MRIGRKKEGTPYERWGGEPFFTDLVDRFYDGVTTDPLLAHMYPDDLTESKAHLALFLDAVLGRTDHLQRAAWPPPAAHAPRPLRHRHRRGRRLARAHDRGRPGRAAWSPTTRRSSSTT